MKRLPVKFLSKHAKLPVYGSSGAGAFDVHACLKPWPMTKDPAPALYISPGQHVMIGTGLVLEIPKGEILLMNVRSGMGAKYGMRLRNTIGYIDSDYRGELFVCLENTSGETYVVQHGERIAQCTIVPAPQYEFVLVDELSETVRGAGGFGSTGA